MKAALLGLLAGGVVACHAIAADIETPAQIRRIVAQSLCLAVAYPDSSVSRDSEAVYALYAPALRVKSPLEARRKVEQLAIAANPSAPSPVGSNNLALAKCTLFAERHDVLQALGGASPRRQR